jgi:hypothetical protein
MWSYGKLQYAQNNTKYSFPACMDKILKSEKSKLAKLRIQTYPKIIHPNLMKNYLLAYFLVDLNFSRFITVKIII